MFEDRETGEIYVAIGDGERIPYRQFILDSVFQLARPFFSSPASNITAINPKKLAGLIGAMLARQSRAPGTVVDVLVNEFLVTTEEEAKKLGVKIGDLKEGKLDALIERVLIQYGDDSVQELEFSSVLFNSVSNLAAKAIEDRRLGAFIEQSSRYVKYNQKDPVTGKWLYYRPQEILDSPLRARYEEVLDHCFDVYDRLIDGLEAFYTKLKPLEEVEYAIRANDETKLKYADLGDEKEQKLFKRTYGFDIRTKACDTARIMLPGATLTGLGMVANGRTYEHLLKRLYSSPYSEFHDVANKLHDTLNKLIPKYVKRANRDGVPFWKETDAAIRSDIANYLPGVMSPNAAEVENVKLHDVPKMLQPHAAAEVHQLAAVYFPYCHASYDRLVQEIGLLPEAQRAELMRRAVGERSGRRDRSTRGFEHGYDITAEIVTDFGAFRDLHRHRMCTLQWQRPNPHLGFDIPADIEAIGMADECRAAAELVRGLYEDISRQINSFTAEYVVLFGHNLRYMMGMNLREAQHLLELRSVQQGHPNYRRVAQKIHREIERRAPWIARTDMFKFVDHNEYTWSRADAEARQSQKMMERGMDDGLIEE